MQTEVRWVYTNSMNRYLLIGLTIVIIAAGGFTGYWISTRQPSKTTGAAGNMVKSATEVGSTDTKTFRDTAQGTLVKGGINGDGTHQLVRDGGPSQTVYLTSSIIDLDEFVGKKVQIWGETVKGQKAAWLMDVGRIKILE